MLEFVQIENPQSIYSVLEQFDSKAMTWIVSDLKSKTEIQKKIIADQGFFLESSILRINDFWKLWLRRLAPDVQVVSTDFLRSMIDLFIENFGVELDLKKSEASTLFSYLSELAPILLIPESEKILQEWFEQGEVNAGQNKEKKWYRWFLLCKVCLKFLIIENKIIDSKWIAAYLQAIDLNKFNWPNNIIVDLGTEMTSTEMSLFKSLSQKTNVQVLMPNPNWKGQFPFLLKTYSDHLGYGKLNKIKIKSDPSSEVNKLDFIRVSTQLAEVKYAVSLVRRWCDQGVRLEDIAIISPDIEHYWSCLTFYLQQEGIPTQKDQVVNLASFELFQTLIAYIKNIKMEVSWESLETSIFSSSNNSVENYEKFKSLFYLIIDEDDLRRDDKIQQLFYRKINLQQKISKEDFLSIVVKIWLQIGLHKSDKDGDFFTILFKDLIAQSSSVSMSLQLWFKYLEQRIRNKEIKIEKGQSTGLQILSLMSAQLVNATHQVWIGLDEKMLSHQKKIILPIQDAIELKKNFDFSVQLPEESFYDFNIRWQLEKPALEKVYLCAHTSFDSTPLTSSLFFIENSKNSSVQDPGLIRFDELQINLEHEIYQQNIASQDFIHIQNEVHNKIQDNKSIKFLELSPTDLEEYWQCSFKLLARKGFRLRELPLVGIDLDPRQRGSVSHLLFEYLISQIREGKPPKQFEIQTALEKFRLDLDLFKFNPEVWQIQKDKFLNIADSFLEFEAKRVHFTNLATEKEFKIYFDLVNKKFSTDEKDIALKGRIDRIDLYKNLQNKNLPNMDLVVFDYKSSTADLSNYKNFIKNGELQLLLYAIACEEVLYPKSQVVASVYYDSKLFKTNKGFMDSEVAGDLYQGRRLPKQVILTAEQKTDLYSEFLDLVFKLFSEIKNQNFFPVPNDTEICKSCDWSKICRAPHLMY